MKNKFLQFLSSMRRGAAMLLLLLTCATHAWAKTIYFIPGIWNNDGTEKFWVHAWGNGASDSDKQLKPVEGQSGIYSAEINNNDHYIFTRCGSSSDGPWSYEYNRINEINDGSNNCCEVTDWSAGNMCTINLSATTKVYFASSTASTMKVNVNLCGTANTVWREITMTKNGLTYDKVPIFEATIPVYFGGLKKLEYKVDAGSYTATFSSWTGTSTFGNKYWDGDSWETYKYDQIGFEDNTTTNGIVYYDGSNHNWGISRSGQAANNIGTVSTLYLKEFYTHMYQNTDHINGDMKMYYQIRRQADSDGSYTLYESKNWANWKVDDGCDENGWKNGWRHPKFGNDNLNINLLEGLYSGKYVLRFYMVDGGMPSYLNNSDGSNYSLQWTIGVPAMATHTCTSDGSGNGSNETPFTKSVGSNLTITVAGTQAARDDNSVLYVSFDGGDTYSTTTTHTINSITSTKQSLSIKAKYRNNTDDLDGTVYDFGTIYYQGTLVPSLAISSFTQSASTVTEANSGTTVTINASRENAGSAEITYAYSTDNSSWTTIGTTASTTQSWTLPAATSTITYYVKASMTYDATGYSDTKTFKVYGKKTIKVKDTNGWGANFKIHRWGGDRPSTSYPGETANISSAGGQWKQVVLYSSNTDFIFCNGESTEIADANKTEDQEYADLTDNGCYEIESGSKAGLTLNSTVNCPAKPSVSASAATSLTNTTATINGNISSNGNDAIKDYGFYWGTSSTPGTKVSKGTSDKTGAISHNLTGLTAGTTYYYQAYATNGQGETKSTPVQSFVAPYSVTISTATGCSAITPGTGTQYIKVGDVITATAADGYEFSSWSLSSVTLSSPTTTDGETSSTVTAASNGGTIQPVYTAKTYTGVTLDKNTGSSDGAYSVTYLDNKITVTTTPAKTGYHVDGYYAEAGTTTHIATAAGALQSGKSGYTDGSGRWNQAGGKKLYTKWAANTYTAENNIDGDGGSNGKYTATYDATSIAINTAPTRTGYNLTGYHAYGRGANTLANTAGALGASQSENKTGGKTLTNSSSQWIYDGSDATIYADWSPKTYSISLDQEGGASGSTSVTMTYDASTHTSITNPSKTGYTFAGYWTEDDGTGSMVIATDGTMQANVSTYTGDGGIWKKDATCTLYAKWTPNNYTVTLSTTGKTGYGSGAPDNQTATYGAAMPTIAPPVGAAGYKFMGYFTAANGAGIQYYNADGTSAHTWDIASATTLHAYFQKAEITALEHASSVAKGETTYLVVNPTMNLVPEGYSAICWTLHYAENDNPVSEESWSVDRYTEGGTKQNQVRFTFTNLAVGSYYVKAVLKANASSFDPCSVGTELDTETGNFSVIGSSTVTIKYQYFGTGDVIAASGSVEIPAAGNSDITAPDIIGYSFREWSLGAGVTKNSGSLTDATINISSTYDGVVTAFYNKKQMIYFNNTLEWDTVYVYFYNNGTYWGSTQGSGADVSYFPGAYTGKYGGMTKIPGTSIYYFDLAANSVSTSLTNVVFTEENQDGYGYFSHNNVIKLSDYSATLSMYVPLTGQTPEEKNKPNNTSNYYWKGYWMNYPDNSGYTLNIYDNTTTGGLRKSIQFPFAADMKMPMAITTDLEGGKTYGFQLYRIDGTTYGNSGTMTNGHSGDEGQGVWEFKSDVANKAGLTTTSAGDYTFTLTYGMDLSSNYNYLIGVRYPESTGDFRVQYKDNENSTWKTSVVIPKLTEADTVSYFVRHSQSPYIRIQKCTATYDAGTTTVTWDDVNEGADILPDTISANGVYNFIFTKAGDNLVLSEVEPYTGNFYIRVDGAGSTNWDSYRAADHIMPFSEYSFDQKTDKYSHYFTKYYKTLKDDGTPDESKNIKFVVANDYSTNISDTVAQDGIADNYVDANGWLSGRNANIRFMYNYKTNVATRRYLDGAQEDDSEFLLLIPSNNTSIYDVAEGGSGKTQVKFSDNGNWIYEASVYVVPGTTYKLKSSFGAGVGTTIVQYLKGAESGVGEYETLIGGSGSRLKIRLLYDFKTNRVIAAYVPSNNDEISGDNAINADIMFMREHQGDVTQITFATNESKISAIQNVYSVLKFNKTTINNLGLSRYERDLFYVSFPYNVPVSDIIGFGEYGKHWIIEYYDGAGRAEKGFWADSKSFWKFVTPAMKNRFTLQAGTGYIVALDLDEMETGDDIWENTDQVELIFPGDISMISDQEVTYTMPQHQCNIGPRFEGGDDRRIKDSHWNVLGVPTYHNTTGTFENHTDEIGGKSQVWSTDGKPNYLYTWNMTDNSLSVTSASGYNYKAMHAYIVQYYGDVTFHTSTNAAPSPIVARRTYAEKPIDVDFRLELSKNGVVEDQTFVSMTNDEEASVNFVFGEDLSKEFNKNKANIYTMVTTQMADGPSITETAGNTLPMTNQTTIVPVGVKIAADGEYTFSIPEGTYGVGITLIDNEAGARVNLGLMDYTVTLAAGQIDDRFVLEISPVHQSPTGVELLNGENGENGVRKVLIDNILYIVKDGVVYDAQGKRLQ